MSLLRWRETEGEATILTAFISSNSQLSHREHKLNPNFFHGNKNTIRPEQNCQFISGKIPKDVKELLNFISPQYNKQ